MVDAQRTLPEDFHALYDAGARAERGTAQREVTLPEPMATPGSRTRSAS